MARMLVLSALKLQISHQISWNGRGKGGPLTLQRVRNRSPSYSTGQQLPTRFPPSQDTQASLFLVTALSSSAGSVVCSRHVLSTP